MKGTLTLTLVALALLVGCSSGTKNQVTSRTSPSPFTALTPPAGAAPIATPQATTDLTTPVAAATSVSLTPFPAVAGSGGESTPAAEPATPAPAPSAAASAIPAAPQPAPSSAPPASSASRPQPQPSAAAPSQSASSAPEASPTVVGVLDVAKNVLDTIKLTAADLPSGDRLGSLEGYQTNEAAVNGYADPPTVLQRMRDTGRLQGYIQQVTTPDSANGAGVSIEVWADSTGAKTYFDDYPKPAADIQYNQIDLPEPLGDQTFAFKYQAGGNSGYSISWRRGRLILGVGETVAAGHDSIDSLMQLARTLDNKAKSIPQ